MLSFCGRASFLKIRDVAQINEAIFVKYTRKF